MNWVASPEFPPSLLFAVLASGAWIVLILAADLHRKEKGNTRSLLISFLWGLSSVLVVIVLYAVAPSPAALIHGFSNFLMTVSLAFGILFDLALLTAAIVVLAALRRVSPFHAFRLDESAAALSRIEAGLPARQDSYPLRIRSSLARAALGDYMGAQARLEKCMGIRAGDVFCRALSAAVLILQGQTEKGEAALAASYPRLSARQKLTIRRLARHISKRPARPSNAVNEYLLSRWIADEDVRRRRSTGRRAPAPAPAPAP